MVVPKCLPALANPCWPTTGGHSIQENEVSFLGYLEELPGHSGAPVFIVGRGTRPELVGIVIQRIGPRTSTCSHLAVAVDVDTIRETLAMLTSTENHTTPARVAKAKIQDIETTTLSKAPAIRSISAQASLIPE